MPYTQQDLVDAKAALMAAKGRLDRAIGKQAEAHLMSAETPDQIHTRAAAASQANVEYGLAQQEWTAAQTTLNGVLAGLAEQMQAYVDERNAAQRRSPLADFFRRGQGQQG